MDRRKVFLETLKDIEERLQPLKSEYEILKISGLLRQLIREDNCAVDLLNRGRNLRLRYQINIQSPQFNPQDQVIVWNTVDGLDPETAAVLYDVREVTRKQLLNCIVVYIHPHWYTVGDIIAQAAHVEGGVHMGVALDDRQQQLTEASRFIRLGGLEMNVKTLLPIARVALNGLEPLKLRLERELASPSPGPDVHYTSNSPKPKQSAPKRHRR
jgi:hypothetical protein